MKIFNFLRERYNKNYKIIPLNKRESMTGNIKYLPAFSKEWKNTTYSYDKERLKNLPAETFDLNKLIKVYFNLYFKDQTFLNILNKRDLKKKGILLKKIRYALRKIYVSEAEIKHTANKAVITLYTFNKERIILRNLYLKINTKIKRNLIQKFSKYYTKNIQIFYSLFLDETRKITANISEARLQNNKNLFVISKYKLFKKFLQVKNLYSKRILSVFIYKYKHSSLLLLRKYELKYSLNQNKFNKFTLLSRLSDLAGDILNKKIEFNIINLKSISYNPDLFLQALALKLRKRNPKRNIRIHRILSSLLSRTLLPKVNTIKERTYIKGKKSFYVFTNQFKDLKIISMMATNLDFDNLLNKMHKKISSGRNLVRHKLHKFIFNSINDKFLGGMRLKLDGRLTKRYRADRSVHLLKWKGGLKNINSSFKQKTSVLFRGNTNSNNAYAWSKGKRRVGSFAIKGWISGK